MIQVLKIILLALFGAFLLNILIGHVAKKVFRRRFLANIGKSGYVCLTFDDGPNPASTPELLQILKQEGIKATFFLAGKNVEKYPHLTTQIVNEGHEIGQHGHWHIHPWKCWPFSSLADLIEGARTIRQHVSDEKSLLVRPPYGKLNLITWLYVFFTRRQLAFWDVDPKDYVPQSADTIVKYVMAHIPAHTIILLHDGRWDSDATANATVSAVSGILKEAKKHGLVFATVSEALRDGSWKKPRAVEARKSRNKQRHDNYQHLHS